MSVGPKVVAVAVLLSFLAAEGFAGATGDFDGDGRDEVLLHRHGQDAWAYYDLDGGIATRYEIPLEVPATDRFAAVADLNGDGRDDILMRARDTRAWSWYLLGDEGSERHALRALTRNELFTLQAVGDFSGDGRDDVLLRNSRSGEFIYYESRVGAGGPLAILHRRLGLTHNLLFDVVAAGDLNGDGRADVLLRHAHRGDWIHYEMSRERGVLRRPRLTQNLLFEFAGIGDLDGDGDDDVMLRHRGNGEWIHYAMHGTRGKLVRRFGVDPELRHELVAIADFDGDGRGTALLRHPHAGDWITIEVGTTQSRRSTVSGITTDLAWAPAGPPSDAGAPDGGGGTPSYAACVTGFSGDPNALEAVLTGSGVLQTATPDATGCFAFYDVPAGTYAVKISASGHETPAPRRVRLPLPDGQDTESYAVRQLATDPYTYHWEEDQTTPAGAEYSSHIVAPRTVEFQGTNVEVADPAAAQRLRQDYHVLLTGDGWSQEHAFRVLRTMQSIPQPVQRPDRNLALPASAWRLTDQFIDGDITIEAADDGTRAVTVSDAAFINASPRIATVDGKRGVWHSRRLHHAVLRFVTDEGRDEPAYERVLNERYGVTTRIDDYASLTAPTGNESSHNFQPFESDEILILINMLEEMPTGMHRVEGMRYLVRRLNGLPHPLYPQAPAVAWPESRYVEFMESAFKRQPEDYMHRLVIHEKAHFLWTHLFDDQLKADWIELGGWYEDPTAGSGWSTTKSAEFVSAYAHAKNPNEDMAETISYFVINPDALRARSMAKYEFVRDRIMQGDIYVARIREDLTFEVYNLFPDYVYPGKIRSVDVTVEGGSHEDKILTVTIQLHALDLEAEGARHSFVRIESEVGTFFDLSLDPVDEYGERVDQGARLRGTQTLSRYAKAGYWLPLQFLITDAAGNERYQRASDFGWGMYVDNHLEDYTAPEYVPQTVTMTSTVHQEDATVQIIHVTWSVREDTSLLEQWGCYAAVNDTLPDTYSLEEYGHANEASDACGVDFLMPEYMPSSTYSTNFIRMQDVGLNFGTVKFTADGGESPATLELVTSNPDTEPPEIDVNRIRVDAEPTNPEAPNGETEVTITFRHRDNISGLRELAMLLRDPQGGNHHYWVIPEDRDALYPSGDPSRWQQMEHVLFLPPGSLPGTWGIAEMTPRDRAGNEEVFNFVEVIHFDVDGE